MSKYSKVIKSIRIVSIYGLKIKLNYQPKNYGIPFLY